jgi:hypothetical protein
MFEFDLFHLHSTISVVYSLIFRRFAIFVYILGVISKKKSPTGLVKCKYHTILLGFRCPRTRKNGGFRAAKKNFVPNFFINTSSFQ